MWLLGSAALKIISMFKSASFRIQQQASRKYSQHLFDPYVVILTPCSKILFFFYLESLHTIPHHDKVKTF